MNPVATLAEHGPTETNVEPAQDPFDTLTQEAAGFGGFLALTLQRLSWVQQRYLRVQVQGLVFSGFRA